MRQRYVNNNNTNNNNNNNNNKIYSNVCHGMFIQCVNYSTIIYFLFAGTRTKLNGNVILSVNGPL